MPAALWESGLPEARERTWRSINEKTFGRQTKVAAAGLTHLESTEASPMMMKLEDRGSFVATFV